MSFVELGIAYFPDPTKGTPVALGFVYVGEIDTDPTVLANQKPISLLQENGNLVPIAQPAELGAGGVPMYAGSPVKIVVEGSYSMTVQDASGAQVYYSATSESSVASGVSTGTVLRDTVAENPGDSVLVAGGVTPGDGYGGSFYWNSSDLSTEVAADPLSQFYIAPNSDLTGASGAWVRIYELWNKAITITAANRAELLALDNASYTIAILAGGTFLGDVGGGTFHWIPTASLNATDLALIALDTDEGVYIAGTGGYWRRDYNGDIYIGWFGDITVGATVEAARVYAIGSGSPLDLTPIVGATTITINVPEDYDELQAAFDAVSKWPVNEDITIDFLMSTGFAPTAGIVCKNSNFSHIQISSVDATVTVAPAFAVGNDFIAVTYGMAPKLNCLVDAIGFVRYGLNIQQGSHSYVAPACGVINPINRGIYVNESSRVSANGSVFTGVGTINPSGTARGAWVARGSTLIAEGADFSNSAGVGVYVSRASTVHAMDLIAENCGEQAIWCHRSSRLTSHSVVGAGTLLSTAPGSTTAVVSVTRTSNVSINADNGTAPVTITQNGSGDGVSCVGASLLNIDSADLIGTGGGGDGIVLSGASSGSAGSATITGFENNMNVNGGTFNAPSVVSTAAASRGIVVQRGRANVASGSITGSVVFDIANDKGAFTSADGCSTTNGVGSPNIIDVSVPAFNTLTSRGAIFT